MKTSKSPRKVLLTAYAVARESLPAYAHRCSPKKFTQHQLFACLVLKTMLKLDYRGAAETLGDWPELRERIGLKGVPHFTTLHKAAARLLVAWLVRRVMDRLVEWAVRAKLLKPKVTPLAAGDSSGFESHHISRYFVKRRERGGKTSGKWHTTTYRRFPKLGVVVDCKSHLVFAAVTMRGPSPDHGHVDDLMVQAHGRRVIDTALLDAGYDAEWTHRLLRHDLGIRSLIPPKIGRPTAKKPAGRYRRLMARLLSGSQRGKPYGQRVQVETVFSMIKRRLGESLGARSYHAQNRAMMLMVLTHDLMILRRHKRGFLQSNIVSLIRRKPKAPDEALADDGHLF